MIPKNRPPIHPGEILQELFLDPMGITQAELAAHLGWTKTRVNQIIRGKRAVTPETALTFADVFGTSTEVWLDMQRDYDVWQAMQRHRKQKPLRKAA